MDINGTSGARGEVLCPACGGGNGNQNLFCVHCGRSLRKARKRIKSSILLSGVIGLILTGIATYIVTGGIGSKPVGNVNGEEITWREFSGRLSWAKKLYELRFGKDFFKGGVGEENLIRLQAQILEEIITEKLLLQEAKKGGYAQAPEKEIEEQIGVIKERHGFSEGDFKERLGIGLSEFKEELRKDWIISHFIETVILKDPQENQERSFQDWFSALKGRSKIEIYQKFDTPPPAQAACCPGGGCGGGEQVRPLDPKIEKEATSKALQYYEEKTRRKGASARAINFGCHIQVDIIEEGKVMLSLTYEQGKVKEI